MVWLSPKPSNMHIEGKHINEVEIVVDGSGRYRKVVIKLNNGLNVEVAPRVFDNIRSCDPNDPSIDCYIENTYLEVSIR